MTLIKIPFDMTWILLIVSFTLKMTSDSVTKPVYLKSFEDFMFILKKSERKQENKKIKKLAQLFSQKQLHNFPLHFIIHLMFNQLLYST